MIEMSCLLGWKIIFHDGTTQTIVSSKDTAWNDAPTTNVQYVILYYEKHRHLLSGLDDYNLPPLLGLEGSIVKRGSLLADDKFAPLKQLIINDTESFN